MVLMLDEQTTPEHELQSAELERERLTSLINSMADGVIAIDSKLDVAISNGAALNVLDVNATMAGKPIDAFLHLSIKIIRKSILKKSSKT